MDRRGWQALSSLSRRRASRAEITDLLKSFYSPEAVDRVVADLQRRGWVEEEDGLLLLSSSGAQVQADLAPHVDRVREQVQSALPHDDYVTLLRLPHVDVDVSLVFSMRVATTRPRCSALLRLAGRLPRPVLAVKQFRA